jgi:opacity protein-like surface antigen
MNKLFLTAMLALITTFASAQFMALTTFNEGADSTWNVTDKMGIGYQVNDCFIVAATMDGEDKYELLGRYVMHKSGVWATCIYNYEKDSEEELKDKLELGLGYSYNVWKNLYVDPYYIMPLKKDEDGNREGSFKLGVSYKF